jgi:hypothetical protein|tara:strand:- start:1636 stop:1959 length:324 start_codon:yes stop_codon:yes gene_type:complete
MRKTQHFVDQFRDRVMELPLTKIEIGKILRHIMDVVSGSRGEESICVYKFDKEVIQQDPKPHRRDEDELWIIVRYGLAITTHRRSSNHTYNTNPKSMKVDRVRYSFI